MTGSASLSATFLGLLPVLLVPVVNAAFLKFAALLFRGAQLAWRHAVIFGLLSLLTAVVFFVLKFNGGISLPIPIGLTLGAGSQLALGGWYLGGRARTKQGELLKFARGALLTFIFLAIAVLVGVGSSVALQAYRNGAAS